MDDAADPVDVGTVCDAAKVDNSPLYVHSDMDGAGVVLSRTRPANSRPDRSPWFRDVERVLVAIPARHVPPVAVEAGQVKFVADCGEATVHFALAGGHTGTETEERAASRLAVVQSLRALGIGRLGEINDRDAPRRPRISGSIVVSLSVTSDICADYVDDNKTAQYVMTCALKVAGRFLHICAIATESEDIAWASREPLGRFARMVLIGPNQTLIEHKLFEVHNESRSKRSGDMAAEFGYAVDSEMRGHPFDDVILWKLRAERAAYLEHDYQACLVFLNTSLEFRFRALGEALKFDLGRAGRTRDRDAVANLLSSRNTRNLVERLGTTVCGSTWNAAATRSDPEARPPALAEYWRHAYQTRSGVVHSAMRVTQESAEASLRAHGDLVEFVNDALSARALEFPGAALTALGAQGILLRGGWTDQVRDAVLAVHAQHPNGPWLEPN